MQGYNLQRNPERWPAANEPALEFGDAVVMRAVSLKRQARRRPLGDAPVAATALVFGRELLTHNLKECAGVPGLKASGPIIREDPT